MKTTEFTMPEITISYKDNVKASERVKILSSETSYSYLKPFYIECMEHHEESYVMFLNRANKALGVSLISKGGMAENCNGRENHPANRLESPRFGDNPLT